ncbi:MAG TPA: twin-arginine translocation signal domain-containing protein, partial [Actinomycetes bacterium]|nr:twin-arginine translocation signal domain-containing protein [Actinomycetes bacterium]
MSKDADDTAGREELGRLSRRGFLRTAVTTAAVVGASGALAAPALAHQGDAQGRGRHRVPPDQISIQLYTLRDQLAIDFEGTIATMAEIGYTRVEHAGFVGRTVTEFKAVLDANGIVSTSGHVQIP